MGRLFGTGLETNICALGLRVEAEMVADVSAFVLVALMLPCGLRVADAIAAVNISATAIAAVGFRVTETIPPVYTPALAKLAAGFRVLAAIVAA